MHPRPRAMRQWVMAEITFSHRTPPRSAGNPPPPRARWVSAVAAGGVAGIAFIVMVSVLGSIVHDDSVWVPFHRIAAMVLGPASLEEMDVFDGSVVGMALSIHLGLAASYGIILSYLIVEFTRRNAPLLGAVAGLLIYLVNFYGFAGLFPWMTEMRGPVTLVSHAVFGSLLASCYWALYADRPAARATHAW
jgi:hypothetical protein